MAISIEILMPTRHHRTGSRNTMREARRHVVPQDLAGERADRIVAVVTDVSRSTARALVDAGDVTVDGHAVAAADRLDAGTVVMIIEPEPEGPLQPLEMDLTVAYQDADVLVIDKPAGLVVHPGAGHRDDTLANVLVARHPELAGMGVEHRWGLVHRLDRDTTGLLLVGRTPEAHGRLQAALKARAVGRVYWALVLGEFDNATGTIEAPIARDPSAPTRMHITSHGRPAVTHYRRLAAWSGVTLLEVTLETGRTHQIRVHMEAIDHPIIGDRVYGRPGAPDADPGRVWLHAIRLTFPHPDGSQDVTVEAPLPSDLSQSLDRLGPPLRGTVPTSS
jgi:23S rRNA pseudouridine1911/1915/1917 synthase